MALVSGKITETSALAPQTVPFGAPREAPRRVFAEARGLGLRTALGCPYAGMDMTIYQGELTALQGRAGSGKTALLLTLAARMVPTQGELSILGEQMPRRRARVQRRIGLGLIAGVNDLQGNLTVDAVTRAELSLFSRPSGRDDANAYLCEWGLGDMARMTVADLPRERLALLGIALGMAGNPSALAVDDIESQLTTKQSRRLMERLAELAHERGVAVMAACINRDLAAIADRVYHLS